MPTPYDDHRAAAGSRVMVRSVWAHNLESEMKLIQAALLRHPFVSLDTEFPGVVYGSMEHPSLLSSSERYSYVKYNVNAMHVIQVGLTLCDAVGNLPTVGRFQCVWEFNFKDFNMKVHLNRPESIRLLISSGIDFERNLKEGVDSRRFAELMASSGLVCNLRRPLTWITFHGAYDYGYLIKILTQKNLPETLEEFLDLVGIYFGGDAYDVKHMVRYCDGLYGGLERVATILGVGRPAGNSHQAGSDSLLTSRVFMKMMMMRFYLFKNGIGKYAGIIHGLEAS